MSGAASPCNQVCTLDRSGQLCVGCLRTVGEIARWSSFTEAQKREVLDKLPARRNAVAREAQDPNRAQ